MAMRRRRSFRRSFAGKRSGRQFWWIRFTPFGMTLVEAGTATHSDILLSETDWQNPVAGLNSTQRGGARLERLIVDFGLSVEAAPSFWQASGAANIALIPEFMVWKQSDQFGSVVTNSTSFDATRADQRVLMDCVPQEVQWQQVDPSANNSIRTVFGHYETKSKCRLADAALGVAWRGSFNTAFGALNGYTDWFRPTMLISIP